MLALLVVRIRVRLETRGLKVSSLIASLIGVIGVTGLLLAVPHSPRDALPYSVDSMSTRGASGLTLQ